jgi:integrase
MARIVKVATSATSPRPYEVRWSWYDGEGKRHFKKERYETERTAKAKKREVEQSVADANLPDYAAGKAAVRGWGERWIESKRAVCKPSTVRSYEAIWKASVEPQFGSRRVQSVTTGDVEEWMTGLLTRGLTPPTIKHHVWVASQVFATAARARAISYNPARDVKLPTDRSVGRLKPEPHFLTAEEVEALADKLGAAHPDSPDGLLVRFTAWTGLRAGEMAGLNIGDVDLMRKVVHVRRTRSRRGGIWTEHTPKSGKARTVPLMPWIAEDLTAFLAQHPNRADADAPLWPGGRAGGYSHGGKRAPGSDYSDPWESGTFYRRRFQPACRAVGLPSGRGGVRFHDLRHTFASLAASRGVPAPQVAMWMGHASDVITRQIYTHLFAADSARHTESMAAGGRPTATTRDAIVTPIRSAVSARA